MSVDIRRGPVSIRRKMLLSFLNVEVAASKETQKAYYYNGIRGRTWEYEKVG
jgi:hypothetical protein